MNGFGTRIARRREHRGDVEVALDAKRLIGDADVNRAAIGVGIQRDRADAEPAASARNAARDLAAVGDQDFGEHQAALRFSRNEAMPSLPSGEPRISAMCFAVSATSASSGRRPATARISALILAWASGPPAIRCLSRPSMVG